MLFASINLLPPGINRLYMVTAGLTVAPVRDAVVTLPTLRRS